MRYYNAAIYGSTNDLMKDAIITVKDGVITDICRGVITDPTEEDIDCGGLVAFPAFMDCCVTLPGRACFKLYGVDISTKYTLDEYVSILEDVDVNSGIRAYGFNTFVVNGEYDVLKEILDHRCPDRPGYIYADDMTNVIVNNYVLEELKKYIHVDQTMYRTGLLDINQIHIVKKYTDMLDFTAKEMYDSLAEFQNELFANGITAIRVVDFFGGKNLVEALSWLIADGTWKLQTVITVPMYPFDTDVEMYQRYVEYGKLNSDNVYVTGITLTLDGSIDSGQAALNEPYAIDPTWRGDLVWNIEKLTSTVNKFAEMNVDINFNAFGDRAVTTAITCGSTISDKCMVSITHAYLVSDLDIAQAKNSRITFCVELNAVPYNGSFYDGDQVMLGDRIYHEYPVGRIMYGGCNVVSGNNAPMQHVLFPVTGVYRAAHRTSDDDATPFHLFKTYGENAYKTFGLFDQYGTLEVGKKASFVLLTKDIINMREDLLCDCEISKTIVDGQMV